MGHANHLPDVLRLARLERHGWAARRRALTGPTAVGEGDPIEDLLDELVQDGKYPPVREVAAAKQIREWRAFLEGDRQALAELVEWGDRAYRADGLPGLIADAWADHLFGEEFTVKPANKADEGAMRLLLENAGDVGGDARDGARIAVGEGEVWWRVFVDPAVAPAPLLEWHSRDSVIPHYVGRRLLAVAFVTELRPKTPKAKAVYRHLELHADGVVEHVLFVGTKTRIGRTVELDEHPDLADLADAYSTSAAARWEHGLPMLAGRITNGTRLHRTLRIGISDFERIKDDLLDINEARSIGAENVRLVAKRRVVVPEDSLTPANPLGGNLVDSGDGMLRPAPADRAGFDVGEDVLVVSKLDGTLGESSSSGPFQVLEYSFDALPLIAWKRDLVESSLTRVGLTPQYVGVVGGEGGIALSGTALRIRLVPTTRTGLGKLRPYRATIPHQLSLMARLDAMPVGAGGFGRTWTDPGSDPAVEFGPSLPVDEVEDAQVESTLVGAGVRSVLTSVKAQHPGWTEEQAQAEVDRIVDEKPATTGALGGFGA